MAKFKPPQELIDDGSIRMQTSSDGDLRLYNYSEQCQFKKNWNEWTLASRGLVVDADDNVVARPFKKFFNWEELTTPPPWPPEEIFDKLDGSLGIIYWWSGAWRMNTRGSFQSEQAIKGLELFEAYFKTDKKRYESLRKDCTHLVEIIYPSNRIVVDYGGREMLVYLGSIVTETGEDIWIDEMETFHLPMRYRATYFNDLYLQAEQGREGYVLKWKDGTRCKIKFEEYKRLHRLITGVNSKSIWEMMLKKESMDELLMKVPDEFYQWVKDTKDDLMHQFVVILNKSESVMALIEDMHRPSTRKEWARHITQLSKYPSVCFNILDKKDNHETIMRLIKPAASKPFKIEV